MATTTAKAGPPRGPGHQATPSRKKRHTAAHNILLAELTSSDTWQHMLIIAAGTLAETV